MSYYLDQLLDAQRRAECERNDKAERIAVQPYYWPEVKWRTDETPRRRRVDPPRPSRFGGLA